MSLYRKLFKQTAVYGLATVVPRMLSFFLVPLYTDLLDEADYGVVTKLFAYMIFFNVVLSYGFETAYFRFVNRESDPERVKSTALYSLLFSTTLFGFFAVLQATFLSNFMEISLTQVYLAIGIMVFDALVIVPFSALRASQRPGFFALVKIGNVALNLLLNLFFLLLLPALAHHSFFAGLYMPNSEVFYIFVSNLISSALTFIVLSPDYWKTKYQFDTQLWKKMLRYSWPILISGIAFAINDQFDKILLSKMLPDAVADHEVGVYSACYKLGLFMVLFRTAYTLGIEPFFFSHAENENAPQTYAEITRFFVAAGAIILVGVIVFADVLKQFMIPNDEYWEAMKIVPLIVLANFCLGIYTNLSIWYKLTDKTIFAAYISLIGAAVTLALNFWLIPLYSYTGSAVATLAAYGSMMLVSYLLGQKYYPIPYDYRKIGLYLGLAIGLSFVSFYRFRGNLIVAILAFVSFTTVVVWSERKVFLKRNS